MKVLTLIQPWATLIALGEKRIETRSWRTNYRGTIAIHAGKKIDKPSMLDPFYISVLKKHGITIPPTGQIIAICNLIDVLPTEKIRSQLQEKKIYFGNYSDNRFAWILDDVKTITPVKAKGKLGLWSYNFTDK